MKNSNSFEEDLASIRSLMERSSRFVSLSGMAGVMAGIYALAGSIVAYFLLYYPDHSFESFFYKANTTDRIFILIIIALGVLAASLATGILFAFKKAQKHGTRFWDHSGQKFIINVCIPLITGGIFITCLLYNQLFWLIAPCCLIFYGLALINASSYTFGDMRYLGLCEIALGILCMLFPNYGLVFWSAGFGILHLIYGIVLYKKYDK